jgi:eukaryotic-like serine/threonine-protein kinase
MSTNSQRLGKYELLERLGQGGMAEVWKARDTQLQRYIAIKLLHANLKENPYFIARFEIEALLIASLHHPNIVQIHDFQFASSEEECTIAYMVMDYAEGQTLAEYMRRTAGLGNVPSPDRATLYVYRPCRRLRSSARHDSPFLKRANILLDKHNTTRNHMGEPVLTNFGLAMLLKSPVMTLTVVQLGTPVLATWYICSKIWLLAATNNTPYRFM